MSAISTTSPGTRLHGLDNVRGLAAIAVVALHSCYAYATQPLPGLVWPVPIDEPSLIADALFWGIEGCIMPLFFALSGCFLAQSLAKQAPADVLKNRTRRLLLPMATIGVVILTLDLHVWVLGLITTDRATIAEYRRLKFAPEIQANLFGPAHLWYVQYLWLLCATVCGMAALRARFDNNPSVTNGQRDIIPTTLRETRLPLFRMAALVAVAAILLSAYPQIVLGFQHGWLPDAAKLTHAAIFVAAGMLLWSRDGSVLAAIRNATPVSTIVAVAVFAAALPLIHDAPRQPPEAWFPALGTLLAIFAFSATLSVLGLGLAVLHRPNPLLSRIAAASFWIYLAHHPIVGLVQILVRPLSLAAEVKALIVFSAATTLCLASYVLLVEGRALERLLEGRWPGISPASDRGAEKTPLPSPQRKAA